MKPTHSIGSTIIFVICLAGSCGMPRYDLVGSEGLAADQVAVIRVRPVRIDPNELKIRTFDGVPVAPRRSFDGSAEYRFLPGNHRFRFWFVAHTGLYQRQISILDKSLSFDAVAGRTYEMHIDVPANGDWTAKLIEVETGREFVPDATNDMRGL